MTQDPVKSKPQFISTKTFTEQLVEVDISEWLYRLTLVAGPKSIEQASAAKGFREERLYKSNSLSTLQKALNKKLY